MHNLSFAISSFLVAMFACSFVLKIKDVSHILEWNKMNMPAINANVLYVAFLGTDALLATLSIVFGVRSLWGSLLLLPVIHLLPKIFRRLSNTKQGCPCFGQLSTNQLTEFNYLYAGVSVALIFVAGVAKSSFENRSIEALFSSLPLVAAFFWGKEVLAKVFTGVVIKNKVRSSIIGESMKRPAALVFVSKSCPICMDFLRYMEGYSLQFHAVIDFYFFLDGVTLKENMRFGGGVAVSDQYVERENLGVRKNPTLFLSDDGALVKFVGVPAATLGLSKVVTSRLSSSSASV